jgi:hypothetical protein
VTVVVAKQNRSGVLLSPAFDPAPVIGGPIQPNTNYVMTALMDAADIADPTLVLTNITLQASYDGGATWRILRGPEDWTCGARNRQGVVVAPYLNWGGGDPPFPNRFRMGVTLPRTLSFGLDLAFGSTLG